MYLCSTDAAIHRASAKIYTGGGGGKGGHPNCHPSSTTSAMMTHEPLNPNSSHTDITALLLVSLHTADWHIQCHHQRNISTCCIGRS